MKRLLLKLAYGILKIYKEKPTSTDLGDVILIRGNRFVVTDYVITRELGGCDKVEVRARDMLEVLVNGRDR